MSRMLIPIKIGDPGFCRSPDFSRDLFGLALTYYPIDL